jgi:hypothetical protein
MLQGNSDANDRPDSRVAGSPGAGWERHGRKLAFAGLLGLALALRTIGLRYGLPYLTYFHDEPQVVLRALRFGTGDVNPHFFGWPGILLFEVAFLSFVLLFAWGRLAGLWRGASDFATAYFVDPTAFYLLARLQSVLTGTWTVWIVQRLGQDAYSAPVGWSAAVGLAVSSLHGHYSHLAHPVIVMTAFTTLGLWAAIRLATQGGRRDLAVAALAIGLGSAAQYHALLLVPVVCVAGVLRGLKQREERGWWWRATLLVVAGGVAIHLMLSPFTLLDHRQFLHDLRFEAVKASGGGVVDPRSALLHFWNGALVPSISLPVLLVAAAGLLVALFRRTAADMLLLLFVVEYAVVMSRSAVVNDRYGLPLLPLALLFAGRALEAAASLLRVRRARSALLCVAMGALSWPSAAKLVETDLAMRGGDTRVIAMRWFEQHVPADARVVIDMHRFLNTSSPPLAENAQRLHERIAEVERGVEGSGASRAYSEMYRQQLAHPRHPAYYLRGTRMGSQVEPMDSVVAQGFTWAIVSSDAVERTASAATADDRSGLRWYAELAGRAALMHEVRAEARTSMGPTIRIYRLPAIPPPRPASGSAR